MHKNIHWRLSVMKRNDNIQYSGILAKSSTQKLLNKDNINQVYVTNEHKK